jgi:hypothetical protein
MSNPTATAPCMSRFTTAKGEHWCSVEVGIDHAAKAYAAGRTVAHDGPCVEITRRWGAVENTIWAAMKSNAHLVRPVAPTVAIHTAGELHPAPKIEGRVTFTFNLSDLLDDPLRKPDANLVKRNGLDHRMEDFVFCTEGAGDLYDDMVRTISRQLERGKSVTVLVLCRGGKHRSVAFGHNLAQHFEVEATHHHIDLPIVKLAD